MTVEALRRRRPETLGDLLEAYGRELQSVAYLILRDRAEAEDVVIETLLTAFERGGDDPRRARPSRLAPPRRDEPGPRAAARRSARVIRLDSCRTEPPPATSARTAPRGSPCSTASPTCPSRCELRSSCATTPTSPSTSRRHARQEPEHDQGAAPDRARPPSDPPRRPGRRQPRGGDPCMTRTSTIACGPSFRTEGDGLPLTITPANSSADWPSVDGNATVAA